MPMICTGEFSCGGEGFHVEEEKVVYRELVHKKGISAKVVDNARYLFLIQFIRNLM